jgi:hypothetical protein
VVRMIFVSGRTVLSLPQFLLHNVRTNLPAPAHLKNQQSALGV